MVNEDYMTYNDAGLPASEYQNPSGSISVNTATVAVTDSTPYVGYNYDAGNGYRLASIQYPNLDARFSYNYGTTGTPDDSLNRLSEIDDNATAQPLASYQYLGLDTIVTEKYQEPEIELDFTGGTDAYTGLDQFGRVIDQVWKNYSTGGSPLDEFKYGYNSAGDVQWKQNVAADNAELQFDESYTYNDLGELTGAQRGPLTSDGHGRRGSQRRHDDLLGGPRRPRADLRQRCEPDRRLHLRQRRESHV